MNKNEVKARQLNELTETFLVLKNFVSKEPTFDEVKHKIYELEKGDNLIIKNIIRTAFETGFAFVSSLEGIREELDSIIDEIQTEITFRKMSLANNKELATIKGTLITWEVNRTAKINSEEISRYSKVFTTPEGAQHYLNKRKVKLTDTNKDLTVTSDDHGELELYNSKLNKEITYRVAPLYLHI
ncbi:hypothetical protein AB733_23035 [Photobacterium swingsii]|uniref:Uncharacterized protein n=1 Tax=Photobacterium swingsii TaxID=680026 RepID=A0A0J8V541_9GAMM|nr:hypothetical protein [Photobacterium swingsii]KMV28553.1 hypothetical protein AB733_23035 [Photobacterium swingsii]PSW24523.1 hypothetical protein C9I94_10835 [Photobacterium swingsii]